MLQLMTFTVYLYDKYDRNRMPIICIGTHKYLSQYLIYKLIYSLLQIDS